MTGEEVFLERLWKAVDYAEAETDLSYAGLIGCLEVVKYDLMRRCPNVVEGDEDEEEAAARG